MKIRLADPTVIEASSVAYSLRSEKWGKKSGLSVNKNRKSEEVGRQVCGGHEIASKDSLKVALAKRLGKEIMVNELEAQLDRLDA